MLYIQNLTVGGFGPYYGLIPTWSLAIEEQFYLIFPLLVWLCPRKSLFVIAVSIFLLSPLMRLFVLHQTGNWTTIYLHTLCRLDGFSVGALLAVFIGSFTATTLKRVSLAAIFLGLVGSAAQLRVGFCTDQHSVTLYSFLALLLACWGMTLSKSANFLCNRSLAFTGKISYGLYLLHMLAFWVVDIIEKRTGLNRHAGFALALGLSFAMATMSWYSFELRFLRLKDRFRASTRPGSLESHPPQAFR